MKEYNNLISASEQQIQLGQFNLKLAHDLETEIQQVDEQISHANETKKTAEKAAHVLASRSDTMRSQLFSLYSCQTVDLKLAHELETEIQQVDKQISHANETKKTAEKAALVLASQSDVLRSQLFKLYSCQTMH